MPHSQVPENNPNNKVAIKITQLSSSKILVEPLKKNLFPKNHHLALKEESIGLYRIFTENPSSLPKPVIPSPTQVPSSYPTKLPSLTPTQTSTSNPSLTDSLSLLRERLFVLGGNVGDHAEHVDSISRTTELYDPLSGQWRKLPSMIYRRSDHVAVNLGGKIYVFGGAHKDRSSVNSAEIYDPISSQWQKINPPPYYSNMKDFNAFPWGNKIYLIFSGITKEGKEKSFVYSYDIITGSYQEHQSPEKTVRYCFEKYAQIYCLRRDESIFIFRYTPSSNSWEKIPIENRQRVQEGIVGYDYGVYAAIRNNYGHNSLYRFDINKAKFISLGIPLTEKNGKELFGYLLNNYGSALIFIGGEVNEGGTYRAQKNILAYDHSYQLVNLPPMIEARANPAATTLAFPPKDQGGVIKGKITEGEGGAISTLTRVSLYKIISWFPNGGSQTKLIASQNIGPEGNFAFYGLDEGEYNLYAGGDYNEYSNRGFQNPIKTRKESKG